MGNKTDVIGGSFNTQPPEGGWSTAMPFSFFMRCFNTQPPEGGWPSLSNGDSKVVAFQHTAA